MSTGNISVKEVFRHFSRDLKPENIMLSEKDDDLSIKVIDWGTSRRFDSKKRMKRLVGTVPFPLILKITPPSHTTSLQKSSITNTTKSATSGPSE